MILRTLYYFCDTRMDEGNYDDDGDENEDDVLSLSDGDLTIIFAQV